MARTVNEQEYAKKRNEILDTAQRLIHSKGYERMTIQDIMNELQISSGAFYHYFGSKPAVLDAFIERIREETEKPLLPIIRDHGLTAVEKLQGFFDTLDRLRYENKADIVKLGLVWYADENAIVRQKVEEAVRDQRAPLLTQIVHQGVREGLFTTVYPDLAGEVILSLLQGMGNTHAKLLLSLEQDRESCMERIAVTHASYMDAIERVLGTSPNALYRLDPEAVETWVMTDE